MEEPTQHGMEQGQEKLDFSADLTHILSLLLNNEDTSPESIHPEIERFIATYDPYRTDDNWLMQKSHILVNSYLVSVLVDRFEMLNPKHFLQLLLLCASIAPTDVAVLFREGQASCEILQTMDQAIQNPEILSLGARVLGLAAASHSKFRAEIATGDGVSLFVEAMKSHSKDVPTLVALFIAMVNISYNNKDNKNTFIAHDGLDVFQSAFTLCSTMKDQLDELKAPGSPVPTAKMANGTHGSPEKASHDESSPRSADGVLYSEAQLDHLASVSLSLLRNIASVVPRETSAEPLIRSLLHFSRTFLSDKPDLVSSALVCIGSLLATSPSLKTQFVTKWNGLEELSKLWDQYTLNARVMQPLTVILQLLSKVNAHRAVIAQDFMERLHEQFTLKHTRDAGVLHPTMSVLYQFTFNTKTRALVANLPEIMKTLLLSLQVNMPSPRLHAVTSKVLIRLCAIDQCKRQIQAEGGITAILTPMNAYSGDTRVTKFLAQLVNIVLTSTAPAGNTSNAASSPSPGASNSGQDPSRSAAARRQRLANTHESDSYSDSSSDSYSDSDSDSDSDSSSSSGSSGSSSSSSSGGSAGESPKKAPAPLPVLTASDLDAAIAELEASTAQFSFAAPTAAATATTPTKTSGSGKKGTPKRGTPGRSEPTTPESDATKESAAVDAQLKAELDRVKTQLTAWESIAAHLKKENDELKQSAIDSEMMMPKLKLELSVAKQEAVEAREAEQKATEELEAFKEEIRADNAVMESQMTQLAESLTALQTQKQAIDAETEKSSALEKTNLELSKQLETTKAELEQARASVSTSSDELDRNQRKLEDEKKALKEEMAQLRTELDANNKSRVDIETRWRNEIQEMKDALERREQTKAELEEELENLRRERDSLSHSLATASKALASTVDKNNMDSGATAAMMKAGETPTDSSSESGSTNQVFSQPAPSFLAQSASPSSSATGDGTDLHNGPLSASHPSGQTDTPLTSTDVLIANAPAITTPTTSMGNVNSSTGDDALSMKEKGWIRLEEHNTTVADLESQISRLKFELHDAQEHSLHFQVLSIRLDYLGRGDPVPSIESIRQLLLTGDSDQLPKITSPRERAAHHAAIVAHSYPGHHKEAELSPLAPSGSQTNDHAASTPSTSSSQPLSNDKPKRSSSRRK